MSHLGNFPPGPLTLAGGGGVTSQWGLETLQQDTSTMVRGHLTVGDDTKESFLKPAVTTRRRFITDHLEAEPQLHTMAAYVTCTAHLEIRKWTRLPPDLHPLPPVVGSTLILSIRTPSGHKRLTAAVAHPSSEFQKLSVCQLLRVRMAESQASAPECPICFQPYNNAFRMPLKLPVCSHTFCLQCLCQICLFLKPSQNFLCPLCRTSTSVPVGGAPQFPANMEVVSQLPPSQQDALCRVWVEGSQLYCCKAKIPEGRDREKVHVISLLPPSEPPQPGGLVTVRSQRLINWCNLNLWCLLWTVFILMLCLFIIIFFPVYSGGLNSSKGTGSGGSGGSSPNSAGPN
ncbi:RN223 protein, partial [Polypterus senegalus]|nr:RN223 protein [Polypterus senegalus]